MEDVTSQLAELQKAIQNIEASLNDNNIRSVGDRDETMHTLDRCQLQKKLAKLRQEEAALVERRRISCVVMNSFGSISGRPARVVSLITCNVASSLPLLVRNDSTKRIS